MTHAPHGRHNALRTSDREPYRRPGNAGSRAPSAEDAPSNTCAFCPWKNNKCTKNIKIKTAPNVHTMVAPVGVSMLTEKYTPNADTSVPIVHPIASRGPTRSANNIAPTEGTIK